MCSSAGWRAGSRKRRLQPLPVWRAVAKAGAIAYGVEAKAGAIAYGAEAKAGAFAYTAAAQIFAFERPSQPRNISKPGGIMEMTMMARITKE